MGSIGSWARRLRIRKTVSSARPGSPSTNWNSSPAVTRKSRCASATFVAGTMALKARRGCPSARAVMASHRAKLSFQIGPKSNDFSR